MNLIKFTKVSYRANYAYAKRHGSRKNGLGCTVGKKFNLGDIFTFISFAVLTQQDKFPESFPAEYIYIASAAIFVVGQIVYFRKQAPRPKWTKISWGLGIGAFCWTLIPFIITLCEDPAAREWDQALIASSLSITMWLMVAYTTFKLRQVKRRSAEQIWLMRRNINRDRIYY